MAPIFATDTPVTPKSEYVPSVGAVCAPVYSEIRDSAASDLAIAVLATDVNSDKESTPDPSDPDAAMAATTADRFSEVTPVIPSSANDSGVRAGEAFPPAAVMKIPLITSAIASSSAWVSTWLSVETSMTSFIRFAFAAVLMSVMPSAAYCDAEIATLSSLVAFAPITAAICVAEMSREGVLVLLTLPARSVCCAVKEWLPCDNVPVVYVHEPPAGTNTVPMTTEPS